MSDMDATLVSVPSSRGRGLQPDEGLSAYAATKAALHSLTKTYPKSLLTLASGPMQ